MRESVGSVLWFERFCSLEEGRRLGSKVSEQIIDGRGDRKPRVIFSVSVPLALRLLRGFPEFMVENGWEVHVVSAPGPQFTAWAQDRRIHFHAIEMERNPSPLQDLKSLAAWIRLCRTVKPDLVSVGTPKTGLLGGLASWATRVPRRVYVQRGLRLETTKGIRRLVYWLTERVTVGVSHSVLAVSPSLLDVMVRLRLSRPEKILVLGSGSSNGVDVHEFEASAFRVGQVDELRRSLGLGVGIPTIGFVGRLTRDKGFDILETAITQLYKVGSTFNLLVVGGVDDSSSQATLERIHESGIKVVATGAVPDPAIYFQLMDLFCFPTYREGYPNVVLEASASGVPTITTDATGAVDSVIHGETGLIVPMGDPDSLARALTQMLSDKQELLRMGANARAHVEAHFDRPYVWRLLNHYYLEQLAMTPGVYSPLRRDSGATNHGTLEGT